MTSFLLEIHTHDAPRRKVVETFVSEVFAEHFGATLRSFMPQLVSLADARGAITAAAGIRPAVMGPLFIERYLDPPIERLLAERAGRPICRSRIVEVGNLATRAPGAARRLFLELTRHLHEGGYDWVVFAGTSDVRAVFRRMGLELISLCAADGERLGAARRDWGSYYENAPIVLAGSIPAGCRQLGITRALGPMLSELAHLPALPVPCPG